MISNIATGPFLQASYPASMPYINPGVPSAGLVRIHNNQMQVYDGSSWLSIGSSVMLDLSYEAQELLQWARRKKQEDEEFEVRLWKHPSLKEAYDHLRIMDALTKQEAKNNEMV